MENQTILSGPTLYEDLDQRLLATRQKKLLLVCGGSIHYLAINDYFNSLEDRLGIAVVRFNGFTPNPLYQSVVDGVRLLNQEGIRLIVAVGGGSAIDVAKCIKLYADMDHSKNYLNQTILPNDILLWAVPTTAGTGSEATRFGVIYYQGVKQSINHESCIPSLVLMDPSVLKSLPEYQKKCTMMDALCHSMEAWWSVNSTEESRSYSKKAIQLIFANLQAYLGLSLEEEKTGKKEKTDESQVYANMLLASNYGGKAINLAQTTAGHAMCYKIISLYGIAHAHAVSLVVSRLFPYMLDHLDQCSDVRGQDYLAQTFQNIAQAMGCSTAQEAALRFTRLVELLGLDRPQAKEEDYPLMVSSVNALRLKNNPVVLSEQAIEKLYREIV